MTITIYIFGSKFVVRNQFGESCHPNHKPKAGDVLRMTGANGPVQRMVAQIQDFTK
jgi:hypothetical protein